MSSSTRRAWKSAVNHRCRIESAIASTPPRSTSAMRWSQELVGSDLRRRVTKHERGKQGGALAVKLLGDEAADREPDDCRLDDAETVEQSRKISRVVRHVVLVRSRFGEAVATLVVTDDAKVARQHGGRLVPDAKVGPERVDESERWSFARSLVTKMDDSAIGSGETHAAPSFREAGDQCPFSASPRRSRLVTALASRRPDASCERTCTSTTRARSARRYR